MSRYAPLQFTPEVATVASRSRIGVPAQNVVRRKSASRSARSTARSSARSTARLGVSQSISESIEALQQTGGSPLPESVQKDFEERLGQDFSQVRIHTGSRPATTARQLKAKAFTVGNDVVFGQGQFAPNTTSGKRLIAHELTHVGQASKAVQLERETGTASSSAPAVLPATLRSSIGNVNYYRERNTDYLRRHAAPPPPDYYLSYGDKYARRFTRVLRPKLSLTGQLWLDRTFVLLQEAIENRRDKNPSKFDELERNNDEFRSFAYGTHKDAYLNAGLRFLPISDLAQIAATPDLGDLLTVDGIKQLLGTGVSLVPQWGENVIESAKQSIGEMERSIYRLYGVPVP
jgi:hypothetical protein